MVNSTEEIREAIRLLNEVILDIHTHVEFRRAKASLIRVVGILAEVKS